MKRITHYHSRSEARRVYAQRGLPMPNFIRGTAVNIDEYKIAVVMLFQDGLATPEQWAELAECILFCAENHDMAPLIDAAILPTESLGGWLDEEGGASSK